MVKQINKQRSKNRRSVKCNETSIARLLGRSLFKKGVRYRKNDKKIFGKPDFVLRKYKIAIFCDGDFWHGNNWNIRKNDHKTNVQFWIEKIERNMERDKLVNEHLTSSGWSVLRFWGSEIKKNLEHCLEVILKKMEEKDISEKFSLIKIITDKKKHKVDNIVVTAPVLTHYLHNQNTEFAVNFEIDSEEIFKN